MRGWAQVLDIEITLEIHEEVHHRLPALPRVLICLFYIKPQHFEVKGDMVALMHSVESHSGIHKVCATVASNVFHTNWLV